MLAKTFSGGRTYKGAKATIEYLLDSRVIKGTAKVIYGDSEITLALIKEASKKQKWPWFSGVLTFSEILDEKTKHQIMRDFVRVSFPGLSPNQYNILWVNHENNKRTELHYLGPRLELTEGKSFNPYFVDRDFNKKDLWQEKINIEYGLTSHLDTLKATSQKKAIWTNDSKSLAKQIDEMIITLIKSDEITCRDDIINRLREDFELGSIENGFLEIIDNDGKSHILKGEIYNKNYTDWTSLYEGRIERSKVTANGTPRDLEIINKSLNEIVEKQAYGNQKNYGEGIMERKSQIAFDSIKLEPPPRKKMEFESSDKALDEEKNNKKEKTNDTIRSTIYRLLGRDGEEARRRKRISDSIRASWKLLENIKRATDKNYRVIGESLEIWARERRYREDIKTLFHIVAQIAQNFGFELAGRNREIERRSAQRNTAVERSFIERNTGILQLVQNRLSPEDKLVAQQRIKNAEERAKKKSLGEIDKISLPERE